MANLLRRAIQQSIGDAFDFAKVFATTLYTGNSATRDIVSGLDFAGNGGLVWVKGRSISYPHYLTDTLRGATKSISTDSTGAESTIATQLTAFNADGFTLGDHFTTNLSGKTYVAWQFMEAQGFFDIVEYTGDGVAGRTVALDLDDGTAEFGMSIVKNLELSTLWAVQHRSLPATQYLVLNDNATAATSAGAWNNTAATTTALTLGATNYSNELNDSFISYNFAHNPSKGIFCGSYVGTGAAGNKQTTTFPVGWVMIKRTDGTYNWYVFDIKRGGASALYPDATFTEGAGTDVTFNTDGFELLDAHPGTNKTGGNYIFMAIADPAQF